MRGTERAAPARVQTAERSLPSAGLEWLRTGLPAVGWNGLMKARKRLSGRDAMIARRTTDGFPPALCLCIMSGWVSAEHVCAAAPGDSDGHENGGCGSCGRLPRAQRRRLRRFISGLPPHSAGAPDGH